MKVSLAVVGVLLVFLELNCGGTTGTSSLGTTGGSATEGAASGSVGKGIVIEGSVIAPTSTDTEISVGSSASKSALLVSKEVVTDIPISGGEIVCKNYEGTLLDKGVVNAFGEIKDVFIPAALLDASQQILCEATTSDGRKFLGHFDLTGKLEGEHVASTIDVTSTLATQQVLYQCGSATIFDDLSDCDFKMKDKSIEPKALFEKYRKKCELAESEEKDDAVSNSYKNLLTALKTGMASSKPPKPRDINKILDGSGKELLEKFKKMDSSLGNWDPDTAISSIKDFMESAPVVASAPLLSTPSTVDAPAIDMTGAVLYFPFNGNTNDESGRGNHGIARFGAQMGSDRFEKPNSAIHLDGTDDFIEVAMNSSLGMETSMTLAAWVKHDSHGYNFFSGTHFIVDADVYRLAAWSGNPNGYGFELYDLRQHLVHEHMGKTYDSSKIPPLNTWIHVAATWDGQTMKLYRNCNLAGTTSFQGKIPPAKRTLYVGLHDIKGTLRYNYNTKTFDNGGWGWFAGSIDEVYIFNRAFPEEEVKSFCSEKPKLIKVVVDIKPDGTPNPINLTSKGKIPVAILSTEKFDVVAQVDQQSLTFGRTGDENSLAFLTVEDANNDGRADLTCHFYNQIAAFQDGDVEGILKGKTLSGIPILGSDSIKIVPPR